MIQALLFFFFCFTSLAFGYQIPTNLSSGDVKKILDRFGSAFVAKTPHYDDSADELKSYVHGSVSLVETSKIAKLGSGSSTTPISVGQVHFGLQLPYKVDLGLQSSVMAGSNQIQQFGGFLRWKFAESGPFHISTTFHGAGVNFENQFSSNLYGFVVAGEIQWGRLNLYAGTGPLRSTSSFQGQLLSPTRVTMTNTARQYSHQVFRISYENRGWSLSGQTDWVKDFHSTFFIGTRF